MLSIRSGLDLRRLRLRLQGLNPGSGSRFLIPDLGSQLFEPRLGLRLGLRLGVFEPMNNISNIT
jgi:hypothetical protein